MRFIVQGQSMYPCLKPTDEVELTCVSRKEVRIGDVIAYFDGASKVMTVHRVIVKHRQYLRVKGDNNWRTDDAQIGANDIFIVNKICNHKKNINVMHPIYRSVINLIFVFFSVTRINHLLFGRKIQYEKKIGGRTVTDSVYKKYEKYLYVNNNRNVSDKK